MATTKLNTRIRIRYDDYSNWMSLNPVLFQGEMAVTIVPSAIADTNYPETGNAIPEYRSVQQNKDTVLIKVGDGITAYRNLPFVTGRAGDVYDWAKKEHGEAADITIADTAGNTDNTTVEAALAEIYGILNALQGGEGDYSLGTLKSAIDVLNNIDSNTGETASSPITGSVAKAVADEAARIDAITGTPTGATLKADIDDVAADVATLNGNSSTAGSVAYAVAQEAARIDAITGTPTGSTLKADIDAVAANVTTLNGDVNTTGSVAKTVNDAITGLNLATTYADIGYETKVDTLIGSDTGKSARTIAAEELAVQLIPQNAQDSLDTLQEIATWIQNHPADASAMNSAISSLEDKVELGTYEDDTTHEQVEYDTVKDYVEAYVAAQTANFADDSDLNTLEGRVDNVEDAVEVLNGNSSTTGSVAKAVADEAARIDAITGTPDSGMNLQGEIDAVEADITTLKGDNTTAGSVAKTVKDAIDALDYSVAANGQNETNKVLTGFTVANGALANNSVTTTTLADVAFSGNATDLITGASDYIELFGGTAGSGWTDPTVVTP